MDNFEEFLKNQAQNFQMQPSSKVWEGVRSGVKKPKRRFIFWYAAASLLLLIGLSFFLFQWSESTKNQNALKENSATTVVAQKPSFESNTPTSEKQELKTQNFNQPSSFAIVTSKAVKKELKINAEPQQQVVKYTKFFYSTLDNLKLHIAPVSLNRPTPSFLTVEPVKNSSHKQPRVTYTVSAGINISKPLNTGYNNFIRPGFNFSLMGLANIKLLHKFGLTSGLGYQQYAYKIGVVTIQPESLPLNSSNGIIQETAGYRLNNESKHKNVIRQIILPLQLNYLLFDNKFNGSISLFSGVDFALNVDAKYIIKHNENDKLFSDKNTLNNFNSYSTLGVAYSTPYRSKGSLNFAFKVQLQNGNTFKAEYPLKERVLVSGLSVGIGF